MRPYEERLTWAGQVGHVLHREDIYGFGPPVDELSGDAQQLVLSYCHGSVVDFGAGCGPLVKYLPPGTAYLGIESNPVAVEIAHAKGRNVRLGDLTNSGLSDHSFDVCTMLEVLEHIGDYESALREARRISRSHLVLTVPNIGVLPAMSEYQVIPWHLLESTHVNFFTPASLEKVLQRVFTRVEIRLLNEWFKPGFFMNIAAIAWK
jgi:2-polyprenyl-3-methyl-5-hydroxy-6-metoxy-1,4-benzoquinol methylase